MKHTTNIISKMFLSIELNHFYKLEKCVLAFIVIVISVFLMLIGHSGALSAQSIPTQFNPQQVTISGTLHMYLVTDYGENVQKVDRYVNAGEGAFIAFVLKMDKAIDMTQYLSQEEVEFLLDVDTTMQSEFMLVPDWEVFESFSGKDFAAQYAHKRVRVTGTLLCPMAGWRNITLVRMDFSKVEVIE